MKIKPSSLNRAFELSTTVRAQRNRQRAALEGRTVTKESSSSEQNSRISKAFQERVK
jgi:hypothetical protein